MYAFDHKYVYPCFQNFNANLDCEYDSLDLFTNESGTQSRDPQVTLTVVATVGVNSIIDHNGNQG